MKENIKLIALAMLVGGGLVIYANRGVPDTVFTGFVVAAIGVAFLPSSSGTVLVPPVLGEYLTFKG